VEKTMMTPTVIAARLTWHGIPKVMQSRTVSPIIAAIPNGQNGKNDLIDLFRNDKSGLIKFYTDSFIERQFENTP
jgi:hypothetical protein